MTNHRPDETGSDHKPQRSPGDTAARWAAVSAVASLVSALAALLTIHLLAVQMREGQAEAEKARKFTAALNQPILKTEIAVTQHRLLLRLANLGAGTANLKWFEVYVYSSPSINWNAALRLMGAGESYKHEMRNPTGPIPPGQSIELLSLDHTDPAVRRVFAFDRESHANLKYIRIQGCYCGPVDCWSFEDGEGVRKYHEQGCPEQPATIF